jgi:hypothetical protein
MILNREFLVGEKETVNYMNLLKSVVITTGNTVILIKLNKGWYRLYDSLYHSFFVLRRIYAQIKIKYNL